MPIYEYKCNKCSAVAEFLEGMSGKKKHTCPECGGSDMAKQFSTFAVGISEPGQDGKCAGCTDHGCPHAGG